MDQPLIPLDNENSEYPDAGYPPPGIDPNTSVYQTQQYGAPVSLYMNKPNPGFRVITVQPTVVNNTPLLNPLPDYLCYSIFTMLCCCLPLGVAALVYSITTRDANMYGHQQIAEKNSRMARILNNVNIAIGLSMCLFVVVYIIIIVLS